MSRAIQPDRPLKRFRQEYVGREKLDRNEERRRQIALRNQVLNRLLARDRVGDRSEQYRIQSSRRAEGQWLQEPRPLGRDFFEVARIDKKQARAVAEVEIPVGTVVAVAVSGVEVRAGCGRPVDSRVPEFARGPVSAGRVIRVVVVADTGNQVEVVPDKVLTAGRELFERGIRSSARIIDQIFVVLDIPPRAPVRGSTFKPGFQTVCTAVGICYTARGGSYQAVGITSREDGVFAEFLLDIRASVPCHGGSRVAGEVGIDAGQNLFPLSPGSKDTRAGRLGCRQLGLWTQQRLGPLRNANTGIEKQKSRYHFPTGIGGASHTTGQLMSDRSLARIGEIQKFKDVGCVEL